MPVTARLSKAFYDQFGEQVTNELVGWFNDVDATYRSDLREINELNFALFDAKVEQRFAQQEAVIDRRFAEQDAKINQRFAQQDAKIEQRFAQQDAKIEQRFATFESKFTQLFADQQKQINDRFDAQTRWLIGVLLTQMAAILGTIGILARR